MRAAAPLIRWAFAAYVAVLFTGTHWPNLQIHGPIERSDLAVHLGAFGAWACLATLCRFFGPVFSPRNLVLCWLLATGYACIDEGLQAIPSLHRTCAWDDLGFNIVGISLAIGGMWLLGAVRGGTNHA